MQMHDSDGKMMDVGLKKRFYAELEAQPKATIAKALELLRRTRWRRAPMATIRAKAEDLVHDAIIATIEGRRPWNPDIRGAVEHIGMVVWSLIANDAAVKDNQALSFDAWDEDPGDELDRDWDALIHQSEPIYVGRSANPEEILIARQEQQQYREAVEQIYAIARDDQQIVQVLDAMYHDGCERPADIAAKLRIPVGDVYGALQRLRRRLDGQFDKQALFGKVA